MFRVYFHLTSITVKSTSKQRLVLTGLPIDMFRVYFHLTSITVKSTSKQRLVLTGLPIDMFRVYFQAHIKNCPQWKKSNGDAIVCIDEVGTAKK